jgi:hypothetical protein
MRGDERRVRALNAADIGLIRSGGARDLS